MYSACRQSRFLVDSQKMGFQLACRSQEGPALTGYCCLLRMHTRKRLSGTSSGRERRIPVTVETQTEPANALATPSVATARWRSIVLIPWLLVLCGAVLRLAQYLHHRSLWFDEALLALNLLNRSYSQLVKPLDYNQGAPVGFLFAERLAGIHLGFGEYALRFIPVMAALCALCLFYKVAQLLLPPRAAWIAIGLAAVCPHLIYYASELKQYSTDVLVEYCFSSDA